MIGRTVSHFRITAKIGEGGMGEVYRAYDTELGREVAIKVLPEALARDRDRLERFKREARVLASLNHPNIATIYGLEAVGDRQFLVMELAEGETLADRILRGPVPLDEALPIGLQIAEALETAHEKGIVHRDLKPANLKVTPQGKVKVLDFGLAKAVGYGEIAWSEDSSTSPTLTSVGTVAGAILGTPAYMSPEQARGKSVDRRADIWAFGVVLHEMLTGRRLFTRPTASEALAAVQSAEVKLDSLPPATPSRIRGLLRRCLERDPSRRLQAVGEARISIRDVLTGAIDPEAPPEPSPGSAPMPTWRRALPWAVAAASVSIALVLSSRSLSVRPDPPWKIETSIPAPEPLSFSTTRGPMVFSPDDRQLAFVALDGEQRAMLCVRSLDASEVRVLPGTEDARAPFWSPDGRCLGFFSHGKLRRIDLDGEHIEALADAPLGVGGSWNNDGTILFAPGDWVHPLMKVDARGGDASIVVDAISGSALDYHAWPWFLPDGRHFIFSVIDHKQAGSGIYLGSLDSEETRRLIPGVLHATYADPGYLLYWHEGSLRARRFDTVTWKLGEEANRLTDRVMRLDWPGMSLFAASRGGLLTYLPGGLETGSSELVWVDRAGLEIESLGPLADYYHPRLSHDGRRLALVVSNPEAGLPLGDLWIFDLERSTSTRFTYVEDVDEELPIWTPDDSDVFFYGKIGTYRKKVSGVEEASLVIENSMPRDISPDGRYLLFFRFVESPEGTGEYDIWLHDLVDGSSRPWLTTPFAERDARFSPDGRWVAYNSDESGRSEVYLQSFPELGEKIVISSAGGYTPVWRSDGKELYYFNPPDQLMVVPVDLSGRRPQVGKPELLFEAGLRFIGGWRAQFDVSTDGRRFLLNRTVDERGEDPLVLIQNWTIGMRE